MRLRFVWVGGRTNEVQEFQILMIRWYNSDLENCYKSWHFPADGASQAVAAINLAWGWWRQIQSIWVGKVFRVLILFLMLFLVFVFVISFKRYINTKQNYYCKEDIYISNISYIHQIKKAEFYENFHISYSETYMYTEIR